LNFYSLPERLRIDRASNRSRQSRVFPITNGMPIARLHGECQGKIANEKSVIDFIPQTKLTICHQSYQHTHTDH
jgi:hypothetical protein